jgi:hypothetical protein
MIDGQYHDATARALQDAEEHSIGTAMRTAFGFVAIVLLLLWAGVSDAAWAGVSLAPVVASRTG